MDDLQAIPQTAAVWKWSGASLLLMYRAQFNRYC